MAKLTKAQARRRVEEIHSKVNALMSSSYITTKQFIEALAIVERMRNHIQKK
jgi:hypothetical protein